MAKLKIGVCECPTELVAGSAEWNDLARAVSREAPDLFLLNEMPFGSWLAAEETFDGRKWRESCDLHEEGLRHLGDLGAAAVAGTRPRDLDGRRVNEAFVWTATGGLQGIHTKQYFPDEEGYYEARWFEAGERHFSLAAAGPVQAGFLICTELMFNEHARHYGRSGAHVILVPRAVGKGSLPRWLVAMRMAAVVSGAYVHSSNRGGIDSRGQVFGGAGWIVDPQGELVAQTSSTTPAVFYKIDTEFAARAQREYPCYVKE
jgi:N-carbamoylputrescine amidase